MSSPPDFAADIQKAQQLEELRQRDPRAFKPLIQLYQRMLKRVRPNEDPDLFAALQYNLGRAYSDLPTRDQASNLEQAINCFQQALHFWTPEADPFPYALTQANLGKAYQELPTGDRASNLEQAIGCFQQALRFLTPEADPLLYALTQNKLGEAYQELPTRDRASNLEQAIGCFQQALRFLTPEADPLPYALTQTNLGEAYQKLLTGDRASHLTQAIGCFQQALRFLTPEADPFKYAATQYNLGTAYSELPTGDRVVNLSEAISCYQQALRFYTPEASPLNYALTQAKLAMIYQELPTGDRAANLTQAISCYQQALRIYTLEAAPLQYAAIQHNLGEAYRKLPIGDRAANLEQAIRCYQQALRFYTPEAAPRDYALTQTNLGLAYQHLPTGDRASNLAHAIGCFQQALRFLTPETDPLDYALIQNDLGLAYQDLPTGDRAANLAQAISCYQQALRFRTPDVAPLAYALNQNDLGTAYSELPTGDRAANLAQAIGCYQQALRFYTLEADPFHYAMTQNNLGNAYRELPTGDRASNLAQAINCFQQALRFWTPETDPLHYAMAQNNLGTAYFEMLTGDRASNLAQAIGCYQQALRFWTPETDPFHYAMTQTNLGGAYYELPTGDRAANLIQAIGCYQQALRFRTPETDPFHYAMTQNSLGTAYSELPTGDRASNLAQAIGCYQQALRFWTPEAAPLECRIANRNLAGLYFTQGSWQAALDAYRVAMEAGERLYRAGLSVESKTSQVAENADLYHHAAFAAARCGQNTQALLILEQGKTRLLAEALRLRVPRPANVPDEVWTAFEEAGATVRVIQAGEATTRGQERDSVQAYEARIQDAQAADAALDAAIARVRLSASAFLQPISFQAIQSLISDSKTSLLAFCITEQGSMGFIMSQHAQEVQVVEQPNFKQPDLRHLFAQVDAEGRTTGGWLAAYYGYLTDHKVAAFQAWQATLTRVLAELGERLLPPLVSALPADSEHIILLPSAELFLFPLHAAPLSGNASELLCDRYQVSYAPSIEVLADARARVRQQVLPELYAVINPGDDPHLVFTLAEGTALAQLFAQSQQTIDTGPVGTTQHVIEGMKGRSYVHFSCHGSYDWNDPPASGLELADGRLTLADLQQGVVDLSAARLVTLSACETGITDVLRGSAEEYVGIPAGFLMAGVPCVVSSLWAVPDLSTAMLMERFYSNHLKGSMEFAAALREAQIWVRNLQILEVVQYAERCYQQARQDEQAELYRQMRYYRTQAKQNPAQRPFAHPYYWAAFTVNGW